MYPLQWAKDQNARRVIGTDLHSDCLIPLLCVLEAWQSRLEPNSCLISPSSPISPISPISFDTVLTPKEPIDGPVDHSRPTIRGGPVQWLSGTPLPLRLAVRASHQPGP